MMTNIGRRSLSLAILTSLCIAAAQTFAAPATVSGEVIETYCWAVHQVGGVGHAQCGIECAKRGLPVALYDQKSHKAFILLPARDKSSLPSELIAAMGQRVSIRGDVVERGGIQFLIVQSWQRVAISR
ncbi:MAG: hypothetical protein QOK37_2478 [Thermoanaerobaculia bacterium]|jgi:hypothetical protein|nr:hypothetical protein [Thermoanaerobaculia bacterium]